MARTYADPYADLILDELNWVEDAVRFNLEGRRVVQHELYIKERVRKLNKAVWDMSEATAASGAVVAEIQRKQAVVRAYERDGTVAHCAMRRSTSIPMIYLIVSGVGLRLGSISGEQFTRDG